MGICRRDEEVEEIITRVLFKGIVFSGAFSDLDRNVNQKSQFWLAEVFQKKVKY